LHTPAVWPHAICRHAMPCISQLPIGIDRSGQNY